MTESPVPGPVPRFELTVWRDRFGVVAGITGKGGATRFDLGLAGTTPIGEALTRWKSLLGVLPGFAGIVVSRQIHGTEVRWQPRAAGLLIQDGADGHATDQPGMLLAVSLADCIPVYLVDPMRRTIALLHAGWRGTAAGILAVGVELLIQQGSRVRDILCHCGIGICGACYEVGSEVFKACGLAVPAAGRGPLDLRERLTAQARALGIGELSTSQFCSRHDGTLFFSHRGSEGAEGRMVGYLGLLP